MKLNDLLPQIKPPCNTCPYKLGLIQAVINPCPQCKENGYQTFERFYKQCLVIPDDGEEGTEV